MRIPRSIRARLLLSFLIVIAATLGTVGAAVLLVGPGYFAEAMGHRADDPMGAAMDEATRVAFLDAMRQALLGATLIAIVTATIVSFAVAARIANPIASLAAAARRIARGHYSERVSADATDEISELAESFNEMAGSLEATERRRMQLVGDVAHELRTPLATLDGYLEGLEDGVVLPSDATWRLLRRETVRLTRIVNDLSDLWRAEAREVPLELGPADASAVCRDVAERLAPLADPRSVRVEVTTDQPRIAFVDRDRLSQIVSNYVSNAIRFAPEGSAVRISTASRGAHVRISVRDDGPGLTPDQTEAVFERFYRVDPSRSRALGGSGIGLAIARALAEAMGGRAWAESDGPGLGATFHVELPAA
jgi:two-component system, OmpR family, sensor histidine kinase BaeS